MEALTPMKRKYGDYKEGKAVKHERREKEGAEGKGVMQVQAGEEKKEVGMAVKKHWNHGEEEGIMAFKGGKEEAKGKEREGKLEKKVMVRLKSADNLIMEVEWEVARELETVKWFEVEAEQAAESSVPLLIPLANVTGNVLAIIIDFCRLHVSPNKTLDPPCTPPRDHPSGFWPQGCCSPPTNIQYIRKQRIKHWETTFLQRLDLHTIANLLQAANYLNIRILLDATSEFLTQHLQKCSLDEIRALFNIAKDVSPEQEVAVRRKFAWAFPDCMEP